MEPSQHVFTSLRQAIHCNAATNYRTIEMVDNKQKLSSYVKFLQSHAQYILDVDKISQNDLPMEDCMYLVQPKLDGVFGNVFVLNREFGNEVVVLSRDGNLLSNTQFCEDAFCFANPGVYVAEFEIKNGTFEDASRFYNPNVVNQLDLKPGQHCKCSIHDFISLDSFIAGKSIIPYIERYKLLSAMWDNKEFSVQAMNKTLFLIPSDIFYSWNDALFFAEGLIEKSEKIAKNPLDVIEGACIKKAKAIWQRGTRTTDYIKVVRYKFFDLYVSSFKEGKGKHANTVGALVVRWRAFGIKENPPISLPVDGKIAYKSRRDWYVKHSRSGWLTGKIAKVRTKGFTNSGMLRQAKFIEFRWDKSEPDL